MKIDYEAIIKAYNNGESMNSIARAFGTYTTTIKRILEKNNVKLRHDTRGEGELYVKDGDKLIEWAKAQGRPVTKAELAKVIGRKKLSPSYFIKYPELGQYVQTRTQKSLENYIDKLYSWLRENNIPYKPNDRTVLGGLSIDALLLGGYSNLALQISERATYVSKKKHDETLQLKLERAEKAGLQIIFLNKEHFDNLDGVKLLLDGLKN